MKMMKNHKNEKMMKNDEKSKVGTLGKMQILQNDENHENDEKSRKIKNKTRRSGPIRKQQKISQARKRGLCLRNRRKSKKNKNTKKSFFFFFLLLRDQPTQPFKQSTAEIPLAPLGLRRVFLQLIVWRVGWAVKPAHPTRTYFIEIKRKKKNKLR